MEDPIIELRHVWKTYQMGSNVVNALKDVSMNIHKGEFVAVVGPSGSGKSTMMNIIGCLDIPSKGHVFLDGHDIAKLSESDLATIRGKKIGFVFQQFNLIPTLTALENATLPMMFQETTTKQRQETGMKLLTHFGLKERAFHPNCVIFKGATSNFFTSASRHPSPSCSPNS